MFRKVIFSMCMMFGLSSIGKAECKANLYADDFNGELSSINDVNDFCSKRASWFRIDTGKYQPKDYCFSRKESRYDSYGKEYYVYPTSFFFPLRSFSGSYPIDIWNSIYSYMRNFHYQGWPSSIKIQFDSRC